MKILSTLLLSSLILISSGCSTRIAGFTAISDRNIKTKDVKISDLPKTKNAVGKSSKFVFLFIPFGVPTVKEALEDALVNYNGDLMLDASLYHTSWWFIVGEVGYELRGTVVNTQQGSAQ